jgi:hypothetical protein
VQLDFNHTTDSNDNGGHDGGFGKEMEESIETLTQIHIRKFGD